MKKTLSFILALAMILCMSVTAFAAEGEQTGSTTIQATVPAPSYTIHVPATVNLEYDNTEVQEVGAPYVTDAKNIPADYAISYYVKPKDFKDLSDGSGNSIETELWAKLNEGAWESTSSYTTWGNVLYRQFTGDYPSYYTFGIKVPSWEGAAPGTYTTSLEFYFYVDFDYSEY